MNVYKVSRRTLLSWSTHTTATCRTKRPGQGLALLSGKQYSARPPLIHNAQLIDDNEITKVTH